MATPALSMPDIDFRRTAPQRVLVAEMEKPVTLPLYGLVAQDLGSRGERYIAVVTHFYHPDQSYGDIPLFGVSSTPHAAIEEVMDVLATGLERNLASPSALNHLMRKTAAGHAWRLDDWNSDRAKAEALYCWLNDAVANLLPDRTHEIFHIQSNVLKHDTIPGLSCDVQTYFYGMGMIFEKNRSEKLEVSFWDKNTRHELDALTPELPLYCVVQPDPNSGYTAYLPQVLPRRNYSRELHYRKAPTLDSAVNHVLEQLRIELRSDIERTEDDKIRLAIDIPLTEMLQCSVQSIAKILTGKSVTYHRTEKLRRLHTPDLAADIVAHIYRLW